MQHPSLGLEVSRSRGFGRRADRAVFVSDTHLGTPGIQATRLLALLETLECEHLYLVGDIVDFHRLKRRWHWESSHRAVVDEILRLAAGGVRVTYIPGNHDWFMRGYAGLDVSGITIARRAIHETADGRRFLVVHGDEFDRAGRMATLVADGVVAALHAVSRMTNSVRAAAGLGYVPLGTRVRESIQRLIPSIAQFEADAASEALRCSVDGVICGHIHIPALKRIAGVTYCNTGDWVDSCTAIHEDSEGSLELIDWSRGGLVRSESPTASPMRAAEPVVLSA